MGIEDDELYYRRQGFWLRMARERAGKSQEGAAKQIGLVGASKSTISAYERGTKVAPQQVLRTLARWYGVSVDLFLHPDVSADEVIDRRMDQLAGAAGAAERGDWASAAELPPASEDGIAAEPRTRSA